MWSDGSLIPLLNGLNVWKSLIWAISFTAESCQRVLPFSRSKFMAFLTLRGTLNIYLYLVLYHLVWAAKILDILMNFLGFLARSLVHFHLVMSRRLLSLSYTANVTWSSSLMVCIGYHVSSPVSHSNFTTQGLSGSFL